MARWVLSISAVAGSRAIWIGMPLAMASRSVAAVGVVGSPVVASLMNWSVQRIRAKRSRDSSLRKPRR